MSNRRDFMKRAAVAGTAASMGLITNNILPRRVRAEETSGFSRVFYRDLGSTGYKASEVGFGAMNMRDSELVDAVIDSGINYIDTAHVYMNGENERTIGQVMKTKRDKVFLTTKIPHWDGTEKMQEMIETSLKRLQTDHVDLLLVHGASDRDTILNEAIMKIFEDARKSGKTRFIGIASHANQVEVLDLINESNLWEAALLGYNYKSPASVTAAIEKARKKGTAIIAMKNLLTSEWPPSPLENILQETSSGLNEAQAKIKWVLNDFYVDVTIPGITSFEQLEEDVALMNMKMSFENRKTLYGETSLRHGNYCCGVAGCTECKDKCPKGVEINEINRCLGYAQGYGDKALARENYRNLPSSSSLDQCSDCGECTVKCAHGINLTENIRKARNLFA